MFKTITYDSSGAFYFANFEGNVGPTTNASWQQRGIGFDASRSSSVYSNSTTTVTPPSIITNFYIHY